MVALAVGKHDFNVDIDVGSHLNCQRIRHSAKVAGVVGNNRGVSMPHPIDVIVGKRIQLRRLQLSLTQTGLGQKLGVTFQQVQKYEKGTNRVSCSRLYEISQVLDVPVTYFFSACGDASIEIAVTEQFDGPGLKDGFRLMTAFLQVQNHAIRKSIIALLETLATASQRDPAAGIAEPSEVM